MDDKDCPSGKLHSSSKLPTSFPGDGRAHWMSAVIKDRKEEGRE